MKDFSEYSTAHALITLSGDRTYGHINAVIRNIDEGNYRSPRLCISCQIGSNDSDRIGLKQREETYAWNCGVAGDREGLTLAELEVGVKYMRKIERKLALMKEDAGSPVLFSEYCARILIASGVRYAFINTQWGGGYAKLTDLTMVELHNPHGKTQLRTELCALEQRLFDHYRVEARAA